MSHKMAKIVIYKLLNTTKSDREGGPLVQAVLLLSSSNLRVSNEISA